MKSITKEDPRGCGIACVAFALGKSYSTTKKLFKYPQHSESRGYYLKELKRVLNDSGRSYRFARATEKNKDLLNNLGTIVFIERCEKYPHGHYLIKTKKGWMNSWINFPNIAPAKSGFENKLCGKAEWINYQN